jgi:hypothetical protein
MRAKAGLFEANTSRISIGLNGTIFPSSLVISFQMNKIQLQNKPIQKTFKAFTLKIFPVLTKTKV